MPDATYTQAPTGDGRKRKPQVTSAVPQYVGMALVMNGIGALLAFLLEKGPYTFPAACDLKNAAFAFALYVIMVYFFMFRQALSKLVNVEIVTLTDDISVAYISNANRTFQNAMEQMPMFLSTLCVYTVLVNPARGAVLCLAYCFFLALYPCLHGREGQALFASTFPRYIIIFFFLWAGIFGALATHKPDEPTSAPAPSPTPRPTPAPAPQTEGYKKGEGDVYSNSKYLADFNNPHDPMTEAKCIDYCDNWEAKCPDKCIVKHECALSDEENKRHNTRSSSCHKKCVGFNMRPGMCVLFADDVKLLKGGGATYMGRPGTAAPEVIEN